VNIVDSTKSTVPAPLNDPELEQIAIATLLIGRLLMESDVVSSQDLQYPSQQQA
jgi:hypothetical protein